MLTSPTTALITGAGSGLGQEIARQLAGEGWAIAALDTDAAGLKRLKSELRRRDSMCSIGVADVTDAPVLQLQIDRFQSEIGPIDLVVACAGIAPETPASEMDAAEIDKVIRVNLIGVSNTLAPMVPHMLRRRHGHLVAVSSLGALRGLPRKMAYCASKAGLNAFMESLRLDVVRRGVAVTTVCPGWTRTPQTEGRYRLEDLMSPEASAKHVLWAIRQRKRFHAFPWQVVWQMRLLRLLPRPLQDWLLCRRIAELKGDRRPVRAQTSESSMERSQAC